MKDLVQTLATYVHLDQPVMLWGPPGIGKSDVVAQTAAALGGEMIDLRLVLLEPTDLRGLPSVTGSTGKKRAVWAQPEFLPEHEPANGVGILFLDELTAADPSVQKAALQLVLNRAVGEYKLPKGWRVVAAGNRQQDRAGSFKLLSPLANRMAHIEIEPDVKAWAEWAMRENIDPVVIAFLKFRPDNLHQMPTGTEPAFPTPRSWSALGRVSQMIPFDDRHAYAASLVGAGPASEYIGFARLYLELPPLQEILTDPERAKMPDDMPAKTGLCYAVAVALAQAVGTPEEFANALFYMRRIGLEEFATLFAFDAVRKTPELRQTNEFIEMALTTADTLMN